MNHRRKLVLVFWITVITIVLIAVSVVGVTIYKSVDTSANSILPMPSPPVRAGAVAAYDETTQQLILFGGVNPNAHFLGGTWIFNGLSWNRADPKNSPTPRAFSSMVYDVRTRQLLLFGGEQRSNSSLISLDDTWVWNGVNWIQLHPQDSPSPRAASAMSLAPVSRINQFDSTINSDNKIRQQNQLNSGVLLFGGINTASNVALNDTWEWNGVNWVELHSQDSPSPRAASAMSLAPMTLQGMEQQNTCTHSVDVRNCATLLFGGLSSLNLVAGELNDTWEWNGVNWIQLHPQDSPSPRAASAMSLAPIDSGSLSSNNSKMGLVLFGGFGLTSKDLNDTWVWDGVNWINNNLTNVPSPRGASSIAVLPAYRLTQLHDNSSSNQSYDVILFGGLEGANALNDTWVWNGVTWTRVGDPNNTMGLVLPQMPTTSHLTPPTTSLPVTQQNIAGVNPLDPPLLPEFPIATTTTPAVEPTANTVCTSNELSATEISGGPAAGMSTSQVIITVNASSPCLLPGGYPNLEFITNSGSVFPFKIVNGDLYGRAPQVTPKQFAIGDGFAASFFLQQQDAGGDCSPNIPVLQMQIPGNATWFKVQIKATSGPAANWGSCGGVVEVTAFAPGSSYFQ